MAENLNLKTVNTVDTRPFKKLVMTIGELPTSFIESMTYYELLAWFTNYLETVIIPTVNNNGEAVEELQGLFTELKTYVDTYFDNLDYETVINDKLDEMVENGTLTTLIGAYCNPRLTLQDNKIAAQDDKIDTLEIAVTADAYSKMNNIRKETYSVYKPVSLPSEFTEDIFAELEVYTNEEGNYAVDFDRSKYVNSGGNTYYISPDGDNSNDGSSDHPWLRLTTSIINQMNSGDTVIIASGIYERDQAIYSYNAITKGINIKSDGGKVVLSNYESSYVWTQYGSNTYHTTRSGVNAVFDIRDYQENIIIPLTKLDSLDDIDTTPNTWCQVGNELYVHMKDGVVPSINNMTTTLGVNYPRIKLQPTNNNQKYYLKDIIILSSNQKCIECDCAGNDNTRVLIEDCDLFNTTRETADGVSCLGCKTICKNVHCVNIEKDGFNYHEGNGVQAYGVEINCTTNTCGRLYTETDYSNNATTAHDYCKAIRFNGVYNNCSGGVVIDVNNAVGACYNCVIADSFYHKVDAEASHSAKLYLYDCYFLGSSSDYNLFTYPNADATIYVKDCEYQTYSGNIVTIQ